MSSSRQNGRNDNHRANDNRQLHQSGYQVRVPDQHETPNRDRHDHVSAIPHSHAAPHAADATKSDEQSAPVESTTKKGKPASSSKPH